jgi:CHAD domain-containing protein
MAKARPVDVTADMEFGEAARETLAVRAPEMVSYVEGTIHGEDIEELHSLRVACRRLRAALEVYGACFPRKQHRRVLDLVKDTADAASEARDLDVQIEFLERYMLSAPAADHPGVQSLVQRLRAERRAADDHLVPALERLRTEDFIGQVEELLGRPATPEDGQ